ncbi:hypothetical protein LTV02_15980 [Nocardia yamanashiensis]|uniref:hypothetical protein n=1 Tax=Nocardia yamanashiensis TaxID=209247 RepID=UPI00082D1F32|nr:hypothetical protein [Nocardia yamanashiensis]UGT44797.1 hypothetical protein LTV02_15980 [Nocardia yamanashiensis]
MDELVMTSNVERLLSEIFARYGTVDAFFEHLKGVLDHPTLELPVPSVWPGETPPGGRHRLR